MVKNKAKKTVSNVVTEDKEQLTELKNCPNGMFRLVEGLKISSKEVEGCMRGSDGKLCFNEKEGGKSGRTMWKR